jgi:hypothetical protein
MPAHLPGDRLVSGRDPNFVGSPSSVVRTASPTRMRSNAPTTPASSSTDSRSRRAAASRRPENVGGQPFTRSSRANRGRHLKHTAGCNNRSGPGIARGAEGSSRRDSCRRHRCSTGWWIGMSAGGRSRRYRSCSRHRMNCCRSCPRSCRRSCLRRRNKGTRNSSPGTTGGLSAMSCRWGGSPGSSRCRLCRWLRRR